MAATMQDDDARYAALARRDAQRADFFFGVRTTGIYCRPTCPARTPLRKNVAFYDTREAAERAGMRPCKRCRPDAPTADALADAIDGACRALDRTQEPIALGALAAAANVSPFHFQRAFKKRVGVSPKQYAVARRERALEVALVAANTVTDAALDAGFSSGAAMYESTGLAASMRPRAYRDGGKGERIAYAIAYTDLGWLLVASTARGVCRLDLDDDRAALAVRLHARFPQAKIVADDALLSNAVAAAIVVISGRDSSADLPLDIRGTAFQRRVWQELRAIPAGATRTYAQIAAAIGAPSATRAVAGAIGRNELAVAIPCHRVVRGDGDLGGYRWGVERKGAILARERKEVPRGG